MMAASPRPASKGTLAFPATAGGIEWGAGAVDPSTNTYIVNSSDVAQIYTLLKRDDYNKATAGLTPDQASGKGYYAMEGAPYGFNLQTFLNPIGMPCWNGPYGTLSSYDLNTGKLNWQEPFGQVQKWGFYMPESWGSVTIGSPVINQVGCDLHRRLDGQPGPCPRPLVRQAAVDGAGRRAGGSGAGRLYLQGQGILWSLSPAATPFSPAARSPGDQLIAYTLPN